MRQGSRAFRRLRYMSTVGVGVTLLLASCGDDGEDTTDSGGSPARTDEATSELLGPINEATGEPVKIGFVNLEGGTAISLPETRHAAEAAAAYINERLGGLSGHPVELVVCQDQADGASLLACGNQFVQDDVVAVLEGFVSGENSGVVSTVTDAGIPWVGNITTPAIMQSDNVFALNDSVMSLAGAQAKFAEDNGFEHTVYFTIDTPDTRNQVAEVFRPLAESMGREFDAIFVPPTAADVTPQVASGLSLDPDNIFIATVEQQCKAILAALGTSDTNDTPLFINDACAAPGVRTDLGDVIEGAHVFGDYFPGAGPETELYEAVMAEYGGGTSPDGFAVNGYGPLLGFARAINSVGIDGPLTSDAILEALRSARDVPQPLMDDSTFTCDGAAIPGYKAICAAEAHVAEISDGGIVEIERIDAAAVWRAQQ